MRGILLFIILILIALPIPAIAQTFGGGDVLAAVNALRAARGLAPYQRDAGLMAYAQEHSEYQAKTGQSTHMHSDGLRPSAYGITENIAAGSVGSMTVDFIVYQVWADALHMNTMVGYDTGYAGVGVAVSGDTVYVTLDVRPGQSAATKVPSGSGQSGATQSSAGSQIALAPLATATPGVGGSIVHEVGYGQSLWSIAIAYGVKIDEIRALNGLVPGSTDIYSGQKLVIRQAGASTTELQQSPAPQVSPSSPSTFQPLLPSATPLFTATAASNPTAVPAFLDQHRSFDLAGLSSTEILAVGLIVVGVIGLVGVLASSLRRDN